MGDQFWWEQHITGETCHYCGCTLIEYYTPKNAPFFEDCWHKYGIVFDRPIRQLLLGFGLFTLDHVIPQTKGGSNRSENLVAACLACNLAKATKDYAAFKPTVKPNPPQYDRDALAVFALIDERVKGSAG